MTCSSVKFCPEHLKVTVCATYGYVNLYNHADDGSVWFLEAEGEYIQCMLMKGEDWLD